MMALLSVILCCWLSIGVFMFGYAIGKRSPDEEYVCFLVKQALDELKKDEQ